MVLVPKAKEKRGTKARQEVEVEKVCVTNGKRKANAQEAKTVHGFISTPKPTSRKAEKADPEHVAPPNLKVERAEEGRRIERSLKIKSGLQVEASLKKENSLALR